MFTPDGSSYFLVLSQKDGQSGSFRHVAKVDATTDISVSFFQDKLGFPTKRDSNQSL